MKKIFAAVLAIFFCCFGAAMAQASAGSAAGKTPAMILVWVNPNQVSDVTKSEEILHDGIKAKLGNGRLSYESREDSQNLLQQFMIENDLMPDDQKTSVGFLPKKDYLRQMAEEAGVKYVIYENARITDEKEKVAWMSWTGTKYEVTVLFTTMVYSYDEDKNIYFKQQSVKENAAGSSSTERAFNKACQLFINKTLDFGQLAL